MGFYKQKNEIELLFYTFHKITLKWKKDLNVRPEYHITLREKNREEKSVDFGLVNSFVDITPKSQITKTNIYE
jgi:hypothetical protein